MLLTESQLRKLIRTTILSESIEAEDRIAVLNLKQGSYA